MENTKNERQCAIHDVSDSITVTRQELETFLQDWSAGFSSEENYDTWDEQTIRIVKFLKLDD